MSLSLRKALVAVVGSGSVLAGTLAGGCSSGGGAADASDDVALGEAGMDAVVDTKPPKDTAPPDNQPMCPTPGDVSKYTPGPLVQPRPASDACSPAQVQGYFDQCRNLQSTQMACDAWKAQNATCTSCIESKKSDMTHGALVLAGGITFLDVAGCLALLGDMPCAKAYQDAQECEATACDALCPVTDFFAPDHATTLGDWQKCSQAAATTVCASYETKVAQACVKDAGTAAGVCLSFTNFQNGYALYAKTFCSAGG